MILEMKTGRADLGGCTGCTTDISWCSGLPLTATRNTLIRQGGPSSTILFLFDPHNPHRWGVVVYSWEGSTPWFIKNHFSCKGCWWHIPFLCFFAHAGSPNTVVSGTDTVWVHSESMLGLTLLSTDQNTGWLPQTCAHSCLNPSETVSRCFF